MIFVQDFSVICSLGKNKIEARKNLKNGASPGLRARTDLLLDQEEAYFGCATEIFRRYQKSFQE